jgi:glycosyltransferase involved in cell wall biosynthesis
VAFAFNHSPANNRHFIPPPNGISALSSPLVSVLIPCYNAEKYLGETLESVFRQTWQNIEVIVVDDGSEDKSASIIDTFQRPNLKLIQQENRGQTVALNTCVAHANGDFVQYLDADDLIAKDKIGLQVACLAGDTKAVATAEWGRFYRSADEACFQSDSTWRDLGSLDWLALSRAEGLGMMFPALWLIPMPIVRAIGPWREDLTLNNDAEYFTRVLLAAQRVLFCAGARCYYRSGLAGSLSGQKTAKAWASQVRVLELCESYVRAREDSERMRKGFALSWQHLAHACFPYDKGTARYALERARMLHSITINPDGGRTFHIISKLLGWRVARVLQVASGRP